MTTERTCSIASLTVGGDKLTLIAGPCLAEDLTLCLDVASAMSDLCRRLDVNYVFKASYDKANRTSAASYRGPGLSQGLAWLAQVKEDCSVPVLSDVHEAAQIAPAGEVLACIQIPAFLCRQSDLLIAAGQSGKAVNIKKGQFMAPWDMGPAVEKVTGAGGKDVLLTDRGTSFGYNRLVTDMRGIPQMQQFAPVVFDATHSTQEPGGLGAVSGGQRQYAPILAFAALAAGADALFIETHPQPDKAKSDAACQIPLNEMEALLVRALRVYRAVRDDV